MPLHRNIRIGTCGFRYKDWMGTFYPKVSTGMLEYYACYFNTVEINSTYYRMPERGFFERLAVKVPNDFEFSVKLPGLFTHERGNPEKLGERVSHFLFALDVLWKKNMLGKIVAQFPQSFHFSAENLDYFSALVRHMEGFPLAVEFRSDKWMREDIRNFLEEKRVGTVITDAPELPGLMPTLNWVTDGTAYIRFHGRNREKWWEHEQAWERYDYSYSKEELLEWVERLGVLEKRAEKIYVYFNNHFRGKAARNALELKQMLNMEVGRIEEQGRLF